MEKVIDCLFDLQLISAANLLHEDRCLQQHIETLQQRLGTTFIPLGKHTTTGIDWLPNWAGTVIRAAQSSLQATMCCFSMSLGTSSSCKVTRREWFTFPGPPSRPSHILHQLSVSARSFSRCLHFDPSPLTLGSGALPLSSAVTMVDIDSVAVRQFLRVPVAQCAVGTSFFVMPSPPLFTISFWISHGTLTKRITTSLWRTPCCSIRVLCLSPSTWLPCVPHRL